MSGKKRAVLVLLALVLGLAGTAAAGEAPTAPGTPSTVSMLTLTRERMDLIKIGVALAGALALAAEGLRRRRGKRWPLAGFLTALGIFAGLCWFDLFHFHFRHYFHWWEFYHYYTASKYFPELGYTRLYVCTAVADTEDGYQYTPRQPLMRDLATNRLIEVETVLADRTACTAHFTEARWQAFKRDVAWFRDRAPPRMWTYMLRDFGFNGSPAWMIVARSLAHTGPASSIQMWTLSLIDPALLVGMWVFVWWTFGGLAASVALLWWGTNFPAFFGWTGGAYLRQDWLLALVAGIGLLYRRHWAGAGFALTLAASLRVFPVLVLGALAVTALMRMREERRLWVAPEYRRLALGCGLALAVILPASVLVTGGPAWPAYVTNITKHARSFASNFTGLRTVMAYDHDTRSARTARLGLERDVFRIWTAYREQTLRERRLAFGGLTLALSVLVVASVARQTPWVAAVLGLGLVPVLTSISSYYYSCFLLFGLLGWLRPSVGVALCILAAATQAVGLTLREFDERYTVISLLVLAFVVFTSVVMLRRPVSGAERWQDDVAGAPEPQPKTALTTFAKGS